MKTIKKNIIHVFDPAKLGQGFEDNHDDVCIYILFTFIALRKGVPGTFKGMELYPFSKQLYKFLMHSFSKSSIGPKTAIIATSKAN